MKFGKLLTYKDIEEAKKLIGKKVVFSDSYKSILEKPTCYMVFTLKEVYDTSDFPFVTGETFTSINYQFIREVIED